jgi:hypothetical protein
LKTRAPTRGANTPLNYDKHVYWYPDANGGAYLGKVREVPCADAKEYFGRHLEKRQAPAEFGTDTEVLTVGRLFSHFLAWVKENRSDEQYRRRRRDCCRFGRFVYEGRRLADIPAIEVTGAATNSSSRGPGDGQGQQLSPAVDDRGGSPPA